MDIIKYVDGYSIKTPSSLSYGTQDVSDSDAGRTEDGLMHKNKIGETLSLSLAWNNIKTSEVSQILKRFHPEYIEVTYYDLLAETYLTKTFYVGDRSVPQYSGILDVWSLSFNIIQRGVT